MSEVEGEGGRRAGKEDRDDGEMRRQGGGEERDEGEPRRLRGEDEEGRRQRNEDGEDEDKHIIWRRQEERIEETRRVMK